MSTQRPGLWVKVYADLFAHPKLLKLCRLLPKLTEAAAVGHLTSLWTYALMYAQDGSLAKCEPIDLAIAARYDGDPEALIDALVRAEWLDRAADGTLCLHDWESYGGRYIEQREQARQNSAQWREDQRRGGSGSIRRTRTASGGTGNAVDLTPFHERFWPLYPRQAAQGQAERAWAGIDPTPAQVEEIMQALIRQTKTRAWKTEPKWIPHASTWLEGKRWLDVPTEEEDDDPDRVVL